MSTNDYPDPHDFADRISNSSAIDHTPPAHTPRRTKRRPAADIASRIWSGDPGGVRG